MKSMEQPTAARSVWPLFAAIAVLLVMLAGVRWSFDHPYGTSWDEARYLNDLQIDTQRLHNGMLLRLGGRILARSSGIPPANRIIALPLVGVFGFRAATARIVSIVCFGLSAWFLFLTVRILSSPTAGAFAVFVFCLSPEVVSASIWFSTEGPLFLAISAMLYYLFRSWTDRSENPRNWIGLGLAIGLGFLAKTSFVAIALPVVAFWLGVGRRRYLGLPSLGPLIKAGAVAFLVAGPWWLFNIRASVAVAEASRNFVRHSGGPASLAGWFQWPGMVIQSLLGFGLSVFVVVILIGFARKAIADKKLLLNLFQRLSLWLCVWAVVPIVAIQLSGSNHLLRHISPAIIPLAIAVGMLATLAGLTHSRVFLAVCSALFCIQFFMIVGPVLFPNHHPVVNSGPIITRLPWQAMARRDQWDWKALQRLSESCGLAQPKISFLGAGVALDPPEIQYPWFNQAMLTRDGIVPQVEVKWLWRYEDGPLDWTKLMGAVEQSDFVLTAPGYIGDPRDKQDVDNQHNAELVTILSKDSRFRTAIHLEMGRFELVDVLVFPNRSLVCHL